MPKRQNIAERFLSEVIAMPGFPSLGITRADCARAMIDAGHDARTADMFAYSRNARVLNEPAHPAAFAICLDIGNGTFCGLGAYEAEAA